jgi:WhiB family redox-sensing transcriptional regulator
VGEEWKKRAACRGMDIKVFFPEGCGVNINSRLVWVDAKNVCDSCVVRQECLDYQLPFEEISCRRDGMWGGMTPTERRHYVYTRKK